MAQVKGLVENVSTKWDKYSMQVNGSWYGTKEEWAVVKPNKGDLIEFDDGGKNYTKNVKIITAGAGGTYGSPKPSGGGKGGYSNLGVELGHAANLAIQVVLAEGIEAGSTDFYKAFAQNTRKCYAIMKGLREEFEKPAETTKAVPAEEEVVVMKSGVADPGEDVTASDLF